MSAIFEQLPRADERTAEDWQRALLELLRARRTETEVFESYYDGEHPMQFATGKFMEAFGNLFAAFADNWCQIVVDAPVERLKVVGFMVGGQQSEAAWELWQRNSLDVESVIAHTEAGKCGRAYLLVDPNEGEPRITVEHCAQVVVVHDPADRRHRLAALKQWDGEDGYVNVNVYLPDSVFKWESSGPVSAAGEYGGIEWVPRDGGGEFANPLGVVPVIPLENKPGLLGAVHSDLEPAIPLQNAVNKLCTDMIVASEFGAFPQRLLTGINVNKNPATGKPYESEQLEAAMSRVWMFEKADARATSLPAADLQNFVNAIEMFMQHLAAQTRTPPHYLLAKMVNASGDALSTAEAGLVSKCRAKQLFFSDAWEEAIALALGGEHKSADCEAIWANPERQSQSQLTDAAIKKRTLGVPYEQIWLELGYTPDQVAEFAKQREQEQAEAEARAAAAALTEPDEGDEPDGPAAPATGGQ